MAPLAGLRNFLASQTEMSSTRAPPPAYPALPPSLNAGDHGLQDFYSQSQAPANTAPANIPYLGLRARLSQVWMNRWTILLALVIVRLLLLTGSINNMVSQARDESLQACTSVESVGSAMASMPHYLSQGVNAMAADGVTDAVTALMKMLTMTVTGVEEIVLFLINMYTSTYVCLITLVISGSLEVAIELIEKVGDFMNKSITSITSDMQTDLTTFQSGFNKFLSTINVPKLLGIGSDPPKIDLTSQITALNGIKIDPTQMDTALNKLNASIPTFADVHNFTDNVIRTPFELLKTQINSSLPAYKFDKNIFDVAPKQQLTFCSNNNTINDFFDALFKLLVKMKTIFLVILILFAILVCIPMAYREIWRFRHQQQRAVLLQKNAFDPMDIIYISSRPYSSTTGIKLASFVGNDSKRQILTRWFVAYATSPAAIFVLSLAIAGLLSSLCQYIILKVIVKQIPGLAAEVGEFAGDVVGALNNASMAWAVSANSVINNTNTKVNQDVFGWVETSTQAINDTLNAFTSEMSKELTNIFGGTPLENPIKETVNCLIGLKIASLEKGITWIHDNAHITFPEFRADVFSLGAAASISNNTAHDDFLSSPGGAAADGVTGSLIKVEKTLASSIKQESIIAASLLGVWIFNALIGFAAMIYFMIKRDKTRAEGGPVGYSVDAANVPLTPRQGNFPAEFSRSVSPVGQERGGYASGDLGVKGATTTTRQNPFDDDTGYQSAHDYENFGAANEKR